MTSTPLYSVSLKDVDRSLSASAKVYFTKQKHGELFVNGPGMNLVSNLLTGTSSLPTVVSNEPFKS